MKDERNGPTILPDTLLARVQTMKPGESFLAPVRMRNQFVRRISERYIKTGQRIRIRPISEDEIEIRL